MVLCKSFLALGEAINGLLKAVGDGLVSVVVWHSKGMSDQLLDLRTEARRRK